MKKLVLSILFLLGFVVNSYATGSVEVLLIKFADVKSTVKDDIDSNGTTDTTKTLAMMFFCFYFLRKSD